MIAHNTIIILHKSRILNQNVFPPPPFNSVSYFYSFPGPLPRLMYSLCIASVNYCQPHYLLPLVNCCNIRCLSLTPRSLLALFSFSCIPYRVKLMVAQYEAFSDHTDPTWGSKCIHLRLLLLSKPLVLTSAMLRMLTVSHHSDLGGNIKIRSL